MEDMRGSTPMPQIVKIVRMIIKFHPLLAITSLIYRVILLQDCIEEEVSIQWKALKVYYQSTMRALLDPIAQKMKNLSKSLQMHLHNEEATGQLKAKLVGKLALFSAAFLLLNTEFRSKYDKRGAKTQILLLVTLDMLKRSMLWSELQILRGSYSCTANSTSNFTLFILALLFEKFYDNSLRSLCSMLCIAVFLLCVLVVLRPRTDLGLFSFILGVIGSITYNHYKLKFPTWIIASICFMLFSFKSWLDKYWLNLEEDSSTIIIVRKTSVFFIFSSIAIYFAQAIFESSAIKSPLSNYRNWLVKTIRIALQNVRFHKHYPKDSSLPSTNTKRINCLISKAVNIAQGMFIFALITCPVANYKDWLFAVICYVIFCFWLGSFFPKNLFLPSTNTRGIKEKFWALQSVAKYGIVVLVGWEPRVPYSEWLVAVTCYVLWWVRLRTSFPRDLSLLFTAIEFKAQLWIVIILVNTVSDVRSWIKQSKTTHHQQEG